MDRTVLHMDRNQRGIRRRAVGIVLALIMGVPAAVWSVRVYAQDYGQVFFATPEEAAEALAHACEAGNV